MKGKIVLALSVLMIAGTASAQSASSLDSAQDVYNNRSDEIPGFLASIVGDERINVEINESGDVREIGVVMDGVKAAEVKEGGVENATINAYVEADTLESIASSEQPLQATVEAVKSDRIRYSATSTTGKITLGIVDLLTDLIDLIL